IEVTCSRDSVATLVVADLVQHEGKHSVSARTQTGSTSGILNRRDSRIRPRGRKIRLPGLMCVGREARSTYSSGCSQEPPHEGPDSKAPVLLGDLGQVSLWG